MTQRILVCDDEAHITRAVSMKLKKAGFEVETASDGQAAWESVQQQPPDLLITDCQMPRMDGVELCRQLRNQPATQALPVFFLTAKGFELDVDQLQSQLQIDQVVVKPFSPRQLLQMVQEKLAAAATN